MPIPITICTGFAGSGKTTLILKLLPQLRAEHPGYKLALIKNEIGDLNVDTQLAAAAEMSGSRELLGDCICCTNVGQIGSALDELMREASPDRIIVETSGSAEPLKLVLEINRLAKETGLYVLDGVLSVIDAENWGGYANTSFTAKLQAQQTDLIVINKWEALSEREYDLFLDKLGDLDVDTPQTKSDRGWISKDLLFGFDAKMARSWMTETSHEHKHDHDHGHGHGGSHNAEVECISVTLKGPAESTGIDLEKLMPLLKTAPKDEIYRIKAVLRSSSPPEGIENETADSSTYVLNWSFGRWTWSSLDSKTSSGEALRLVIFTAQYESTKWIKKLQAGSYFALEDGQGELEIKRVQ